MMFWARFLCRMCANIGTTTFPIFEKSTNRNIEAKIKRCLNLIVFEDDMKPKMICSSCYEKLNEIYEFVELCQASNNKFEHILYQSGRAPQVFGSSWQDRSSNGEINLVQNECPDFLSLIDYSNKDPLAIDSHDIGNHNYGPKPYVPTKHVYEQQEYEHKYDENSTVLRHSSQFQNRAKHFEENEIIHNNVILPQEYDIPVDRPINYGYACKVSNNFENNIQNINQEMPIEEDPLLLQPSNTYVNDYRRKETHNLNNTSNKNLSTVHHNINNQNENITIQTNTTIRENCGSNSGQQKRHTKPKPKKKVNIISVQTIINMMRETENNTKTVNANHNNVNRSNISNVLDCTVTSNNETIKNNSSNNKIKEVANKKISCSECNKTFTRKYNLTAHMSRHSNKKSYTCEICQKSFVLRSELLAHRRIHAGDYECNFCSKSFTVPSKLERHIRTHTNTRPFVCNVENCGKAFSDKRNLDGHMAVHLDERNFSCEVCTKAFKTKNQLTDHLRIHTNELPFKCKLCLKAYRWKTNLVMHMKVHNGYACVKCKKDCGKLSALLKHRKECSGATEGIG